MLKKINLVVFDFDGTLSAYDSNIEFGKYCFRHSLRPWLFLPIITLGFLLKPFNPSGVTWRAISRSFMTKEMIKKHADNFIREHKKNRFGWVEERIKFEKSKSNTRVILISAGPDYLIHKLVKDLPFDAVICSQMYLSHPWNYKFLCWGKNKVAAMNEWLKRKNLSVNFVRSYSDSKSDLPIMNMAIEQVWINPKTGSRK
jgi:HAD superfamily phosphoserine phosphatase-like hydrolase